MTVACVQELQEEQLLCSGQTFSGLYKSGFQSTQFSRVPTIIRADQTAFVGGDSSHPSSIPVLGW